MLMDVTLIRTQTRAAGVVFGFLTSLGEVDEARTRALVGAARPLLVTNHRAFDMARDPHEALEALVKMSLFQASARARPSSQVGRLVMEKVDVL